MTFQKIVPLLATTLLLGCIGPHARWPGFVLLGQHESEIPSDWSFTDAHKQIAIQVRTPYWVAHSVTIWCASLDRDLFVGARDPETKSWPGWVDRDPRVRLRIDGKLYEGSLFPVDDEGRIGRLREVYRRKYELPSMAPNVRYWQFVPDGTG